MTRKKINTNPPPPVRTVNEAIKTSVKLLPIVLTLLASLIGIFTSYQRTALKKESQNVTVQVQNLDRMSEGLKDLQIFIEEQKNNMVSEKIALENLKKEKENLEPMVEADKKILEAVFIEQEKRQSKDVWYERAFGFFIGIFSSLAASLIFLWFQRRHKTNTEQNTA